MKHDFPIPASRFEGVGYTHARDGLPFVAIYRPVPQPGPDALLIHVVASSLNPHDYKLADLNLIGRTPPVILGLDVAGIVVGFGRAVMRFAVATPSSAWWRPIRTAPGRREARPVMRRCANTPPRSSPWL